MSSILLDPKQFCKQRGIRTKNRLQKDIKFKDCLEHIAKNILKGWFWQQDECTPVKTIFTVLIGDLDESLRQRIDCNTCQTRRCVKKYEEDY